MTSSVDTTFPPENVKVSKASFRAQMLVIANEITALQARSSVAGAKAFYNYVEPEEVLQIVQRENAITNPLARQIAFGVADL